MWQEGLKMAKAVLVDITRCIGCRSCQVACKEWHSLPATYEEMRGEYTNPQNLDSKCYTFIDFLDQGKEYAPVWYFVKHQCFHCIDPACVSACPVGALKKLKDGAVVYDQWRCIGCRYCIIACPFQIPKYEWDTTNPWVRKCDFCADRIEMGLKPMCVTACPKDVMYFDDYEKVVAEAKRRINKEPGKYVNHIYGLEEAGGTSWLYISDVPFEKLGFNEKVLKQPYPAITWKHDLSTVLLEEAGLLAILAGIAYFRNRTKSKEGQDG